MRSYVSSGLCILLALGACDKNDKKLELAFSALPDSSAPSAVAAASAPSAVAAAVPDAAPPPPVSVAMPARPVPKPQTMVASSAPEEMQMKAIQYMVAMRAPHPDDAPADEAWATELVGKLKPVVQAMDKGPDKAKWNHVEMVARGRQIDLFLSSGCDAKAPFNAIVQRLNTPLTTLLSHGVLVVRCNDTKVQCLQSIRDQDDVLCTTAPRHQR